MVLVESNLRHLSNRRLKAGGGAEDLLHAATHCCEGGEVPIVAYHAARLKNGHFLRSRLSETDKENLRERFRVKPFLVR